MTLHERIVALVRERGPTTVAALMDVALYDPEHGYYSTAPRRSGRAGDFFTSVDVGPLFGETIAVQLAEMWELLRRDGAEAFHLVEAGAGDGRLARDILDAIAREHPALYANLRFTPVERSAAARRAQQETLGPHAGLVSTFADTLPGSIVGTILANELLDAMPVHVVVATPDGLREIYVIENDGRLVEMEGALSTAALAAHLDRVAPRLEPGHRTEVGLAAADWIRRAAAALDRGFLLLFDYGHEAAQLYSSAYRTGTLTAYSRHAIGTADWLRQAGTCDLTAHVDLTSVRLAAEEAGLIAVGAVDQTYFLLALDIARRLESGGDAAAVTRRLGARTLLMPGGLGSTMKVLAFAKNLGRPPLRGFSSGRLT